MGFLHEGHLSLVHLAQRRSDYVVVSIFVNPTQFGPKEDLKKYPRDMNRDLHLLKQEGANLVFHPQEREIYPLNYHTIVRVENLSSMLCGESRPYHFQGVTTVVLKLFNVIEPDIAVFGEKDFQQVVIIKQMVKDLHLKVKIVTGKTTRESDGLAMSSRNTYLNSAQRKNAPVLYRSLVWAKQRYKRGLRNPRPVLATMKRRIQETGGKIDYIVAVNKDTLQPTDKLKKGTLIALAVFFGKTRLIDNIIL